MYAMNTVSNEHLVFTFFHNFGVLWTRVFVCVCVWGGMKLSRREH